MRRIIFIKLEFFPRRKYIYVLLKIVLQLCDELGIMIWQDFMFANGNYPGDEAFNKEVENEVTVTVRRLQYHPSVALWAGNNENEGATAQGW